MNENEIYISHARVLQITAILEQTARRYVDDATHSPHATIFANFLINQAIYTDVIAEKFGLTREEYYNRVSEYVQMLHRNHFVLEVLSHVKKMAENSGNKFQEALLDNQPYNIALSLENIFPEMSDVESTKVHEGKARAINSLLDLIEGDIPLIRYRRDIAKKMFGTKEGYGGSEIAYVQTGILGVNLKMVYPRDDKFPILSLVIYSDPGLSLSF